MVSTKSILGYKMASTNTNNEEKASEALRKAQIRSEILALSNELNTLNDEKKKIEEAMANVSEFSSSSTLSNAGNSFNWIVNNMDVYWSATDSNAREIVKDTLTKVSKECGNSGKLLSQVGAVMEKANEKIAELTDEIKEIELKIEELKSLLNMSMI